MAGKKDNLKKSEIVAAETAATVISAAAGPWGLVVSPALTMAFKSFISGMKQQEEEAAAAVLMGAADAMGTLPEDILASASDPSARLLIAKAMVAGAQTADAEKIAALGRVLAHGLGKDESALPMASLAVAALNEMEAPHIKILAAVSGLDRRGFQGLYAGATRSHDSLFIDFPRYRPSMPAVVAVLERHGLIRQQGLLMKDIEWEMRFGTASKGQEPTWELTTFGVECLQFLNPDVSVL